MCEEVDPESENQMPPLLVRISRALELGDTFHLHDARRLVKRGDPFHLIVLPIKGMTPKNNFVYIRIAPMRVDHARLDMVMDCLRRLAKEGKCTTHLHFSGSYEDADAKGWFEPDKPWRRFHP